MGNVEPILRCQKLWSNGLIATYEWLQRNLIWFLLASFILAAGVPGPGLSIRAVSVSGVLLPGAQWHLTLPMLLLAILLFNAGTGFRFDSPQTLFGFCCWPEYRPALWFRCSS